MSKQILVGPRLIGQINYTQIPGASSTYWIGFEGVLTPNVITRDIYMITPAGQPIFSQYLSIQGSGVYHSAIPGWNGIGGHDRTAELYGGANNVNGNYVCHFININAPGDSYVVQIATPSTAVTQGVMNIYVVEVLPF